MLPYWLLLGVVGFAAATSDRVAHLHRRSSGSFGLLVAFIGLVLMIGFRDRVGADWGGYRAIFNRAEFTSFGTALGQGDPAYQTVNWVAHWMGVDIWLVNVVCALIFCWGLYRFIRVQPFAWLSLAVAVPYLVIVVAMGYTRQGVAIGLIMAGLARLFRGGSPASFVAYLALAALFHKTALFVLPIVLLATARRNIMAIPILIVSGVALYISTLQDSLDNLFRDYLRTTMFSSQGVYLRVGLVNAAALLFFFAKKSFRFTPEEESIWRNFAFAAFGCAILLAVLPSTTVVDRLALYILPLSVAVIGRVPLIAREGLGHILVLAYSAATLYVWLTFGKHSGAWIPYRSFLF